MYDLAGSGSGIYVVPYLSEPLDPLKVKGLVACCHSFCLFYLFLTLRGTWLLTDILYLMKLVGDDLYWRLACNRRFSGRCNGEFAWIRSSSGYSE
jgi:hypothetical protein